ncbi:MAG: hypothetical protein WCF94_00725 [bacterium]
MIFDYKKIFATKWVVWSLSVIALVLFMAVIFFSGMAVGAKHADFKNGYADRYEKMFLGRGANMMPGFGFDPREDIRSFGAVGKVVSIASSTIVVGDLNNVEKLISIDGQTIIKFGNDSLKLSDVKIGQNVAVFGAPSTDGSVTAKLIRVMPDDFNPQSKMMNATNSKRK